MPKHKHTLIPIMIRNPDLYFMASRDDIVVAWRCATCPHVEPSPGWDGQHRIRRDKLCECCDSPVEKTSAVSAQDMPSGQPRRVIFYYKCTKCGHTQYYYEDKNDC
jgi:hypothetical protein